MGEKPSIWAETPEQRQKRVRHHEVIDMCADMMKEIATACNGSNLGLAIEVCWAQGGEAKGGLLDRLAEIPNNVYEHQQVQQLTDLLHELWPDAEPHACFLCRARGRQPGLGYCSGCLETGKLVVSTVGINAGLMNDGEE